MARLFYVHWNRNEALEAVRALRAARHEVRYEHEDGARVWALVKADPPDVLVVSLDRLPSHGRRTAAVTKQVKALRTLPVVFVGGEEAKVDVARKEFPKAAFCSAEKLLESLRKLT